MANYSGNHYDEQNFYEQNDQNPKQKILFRLANNVICRKINWLWKGRIARGKVTIFAGEGGLGKSTVLFYLASLVSTGGVFEPENFQFPQGNVIILSAEDDIADTIVPRLIAAKADLARIKLVEGIPLIDSNYNIVFQPVNLSKDLTKIEEMLKEIGDVALLIIDPVSAYLGDIKDNSNAEVRTLISKLSTLASRHNIALILNTHLAKPNGNSKPSAANRVMGSSAYVNAARSVFLFSKDQDDSEKRYMVPIKNNNGNDKTGFSYKIIGEIVNSNDLELESSKAEFSNEIVTLTANEALDENNKEKKLKIIEACEFLEDFLKNNSKPVSEIISEAEKRSISSTTLYKAKLELKIIEERSVSNYKRKIWFLPENLTPQLS